MTHSKYSLYQANLYSIAVSVFEVILVQFCKCWIWDEQACLGKLRKPSSARNIPFTSPVKFHFYTSHISWKYFPIFPFVFFSSALKIEKSNKIPRKTCFYDSAKKTKFECWFCERIETRLISWTDCEKYKSPQFWKLVLNKRREESSFCLYPMERKSDRIAFLDKYKAAILDKYKYSKRQQIPLLYLFTCCCIGSINFGK